MRTFEELKEGGGYDVTALLDATRKIPKKYFEASISKCPSWVRDWAFDNKKEKKGLYMFGPVGTGKTFIAYSLYTLIAANGYKVRFVNSAALIQDFRDDFKYNGKDPAYVCKYDYWIDWNGVLIIDDFGAEKISEWTMETMYNLVNKRYNDQLPTIFTSNFDLDKLAQRTGDRIASRIAEMCMLKLVDGDDKRIK